MLTGFMKILSPYFLAMCGSRIINIHPSLLPKYPGTEGILDSFRSNDRELGVTIHYVDEGVDTGDIIGQEHFARSGDESLEEIEERIHGIEHRLYPEMILRILDKIDNV